MCFVNGKKISGAIFFFFNSEKQTGTVNGTVSETTSELSGLPTLKDLIQFVVGDPFLQRVSNWSQRVSNLSLVSKGHTFQVQIHVELQFFQKGNEQLHKLPVCWIWKRMN